MYFFRWIRNFWYHRQWPGWGAINQTKVDSPEEWRRMNEF